jgi:hypothetical protein
MSVVKRLLEGNTGLHKKNDDYHAMSVDAPQVFLPGGLRPDPNSPVPFGVRDQDEQYNQRCLVGLWIALILLIALGAAAFLLGVLSRNDDSTQNNRLAGLDNATNMLNMSADALETRVDAEEAKSMQLMDDLANLETQDMMLLGNITMLGDRLDTKDMVLMGNVTDLQNQIDIILGMKPNITMKLTDLMNATIDLMDQAADLVAKDMLLMSNVSNLEAKDMALMQNVSDLGARADALESSRVAEIRDDDDMPGSGTSGVSIRMLGGSGITTTRSGDDITIDSTVQPTRLDGDIRRLANPSPRLTFHDVSIHQQSRHHT